jgi:hypothetical protein
MDEDPKAWFLDHVAENLPVIGAHQIAPASKSWSEGNLVRPLVHSATYFARLLEKLSALKAGDRVWLTDWRGDADERLRAEGPSIGDQLTGLAHGESRYADSSGALTESGSRRRSAAVPTSSWGASSTTPRARCCWISRCTSSGLLWTVMPRRRSCGRLLRRVSPISILLIFTAPTSSTRSSGMPCTLMSVSFTS